MDNRIIVSDEQKFDLRFWRNVLQLNTSIPAFVNAFDPQTQRVSATPAIMAQYTSPDLEISYIQCPMITNIPLAVQRGNGLVITSPIEIGKLCTLIFSQRSLDNLIIDGTQQAMPYNGTGDFTAILRCMDMTDAMCFPGIVTAATSITDYNNEAVEIRTEDGKIKISVDKNGLTLKQDGASMTMNGGNIAINATNISITGVTTINGKDFDTHVHSGVTAGDTNTGAVV